MRLNPSLNNRAIVTPGLLFAAWWLATAACIRTPNAENPVQAQVTPVQSVFQLTLIKYRGLVNRFPGSDYTGDGYTKSIYVHPDGSDSNSGTEDAPKKSIQAAVNSAGPGTVIRVREGVYQETIKIKDSGTKDSPIALYSEDGPGLAVINGESRQNALINFQENRYIIVDGFTIKGGTSHGLLIPAPAGPFATRTRYIVIRNNTITETGRDAIRASNVDFLLVENNTVSDSQNSGGSLEQLIDWKAIFHGVVRYNTFENNRGGAGFARGGSANIYWVGNTFQNFTEGTLALELGGFTAPGNFRDQDPFNNPEAFEQIIFNNLFMNISGRAILIASARQSRMWHNTFINCAYGGNNPHLIEIEQPNQLASKQLTFAGNLIYNDADNSLSGLYKDYDSDTGVVRFSENLIHNNQGGVVFSNPGGRDANIVAKPVFYNEAEGNYSLTEDSPGVNCRNAVSEISFDINKADRDLADNKIDCGAFEDRSWPVEESEL